MHFAAFIVGLVFCLSVALDAFQTIILPRRPAGRLRITRMFFIVTWRPWATLAPLIGNKRIREQAYSIYGPLSLLLLLGLWAVLLVTGFGLIFFAMDRRLATRCGRAIRGCWRSWRAIFTSAGRRCLRWGWAT